MRSTQHTEKKYQIFVSSTYEDLREVRAAVFQTILDLGHIPVGMEQFPASNMRQMEYIEKMMENCDYYILILAGRYGSIDQTDGLSYTEKEYNYAEERNIPIMSFIFEDINNLPNEKVESSDYGKIKLMEFREKLSATRMIKKYHSVENIQTHVAISLQQCIRDFPSCGWVRGTLESNSNDLILVSGDNNLKITAITNEEIDEITELKSGE